jgi:hypothetical protein
MDVDPIRLSRAVTAQFKRIYGQMLSGKTIEGGLQTL